MCAARLLRAYARSEVPVPCSHVGPAENVATDASMTPLRPVENRDVGCAIWTLSLGRAAVASMRVCCPSYGVNPYGSNQTLAFGMATTGNADVLATTYHGGLDAERPDAIFCYFLVEGGDVFGYVNSHLVASTEDAFLFDAFQRGATITVMNGLAYVPEDLPVNLDWRPSPKES